VIGESILLFFVVLVFGIHFYVIFFYQVQVPIEQLILFLKYCLSHQLSESRTHPNGAMVGEYFRPKIASK